MSGWKQRLHELKPVTADGIDRWWAAGTQRFYSEEQVRWIEDTVEEMDKE